MRRVLRMAAFAATPPDYKLAAYTTSYIYQIYSKDHPRYPTLG